MAGACCERIGLKRRPAAIVIRERQNFGKCPDAALRPEVVSENTFTESAGAVVFFSGRDSRVNTCGKLPGEAAVSNTGCPALRVCVRHPLFASVTIVLQETGCAAPLLHGSARLGLLSSTVASARKRAPCTHRCKLTESLLNLHSRDRARNPV